MSILESFGIFYQSLNISGLIIVWGFLFIFLFFVVTTFLLLGKNKELTKVLSEKIKRQMELEAEKKALLEKKIDKVAVKDLDKEVNVVQEKQDISIDNGRNDVNLKKKSVISNDEKKIVETENKKEVNDSEIKNVSQIELNTTNDSNSSSNNLYNKNTFKDNKTRFQTSPINIVREATLDETMQKLKPIEVGESKQEEKQNNINFVEEISRKMEQEVKPQTIELTDYELKQEEEAIISYDELMKNKDRLFKITDDEADDAQFIEELKYFRNSLQ